MYITIYLYQLSFACFMLRAIIETIPTMAISSRVHIRREADRKIDAVLRKHDN